MILLQKHHWYWKAFLSLTCHQMMMDRGRTRTTFSLEGAEKRKKDTNNELVVGEEKTD